MECSTPNGIKGLNKDYEKVNQFYHQVCSTPNGIKGLNKPGQTCSIKQPNGSCSTPNGIKGLNNPKHNRDGHCGVFGAQRLMASKV